MTNVMTQAWEIARQGRNKFGGKVKEYFAEALRMAWAIFKKGAKKMNKVKGTIKDFALPKLEGSPKQIAWAEKIRQEAAGTLRYEVAHEEYQPGVKRPVDGLIDALQSEEETEAYLKDCFNVESTIKSMNALLDRYDRLMEIASNTSAKFWIDNRGNDEKNYMYKKFANYVQTGVKEF